MDFCVCTQHSYGMDRILQRSFFKERSGHEVRSSKQYMLKNVVMPGAHS